ncbi:unnamed protein product [Rhizopus stolonifer]
MTFKVLIVGAGPAGLTLANALKNQGISFTVFERDEQSDSRKQGWSFGFNRGIQALRQYIPAHRFDTLEAQVSTDPYKVRGYTTLRIIHEEKQALSFGSPEFESYRMNRQRFRHWLLQDVQDHVIWNKRALGYEELEDRVQVRFEDGSVEEGDLLVATDGSMSRLAQQLLGDLPTINPVRCFAFTRWLDRQELLEVVDETTQATIACGRYKQEGVCMFYTLNDVKPELPKPYEAFCLLSQYGTNPKPSLDTLRSWASGFAPAQRKLVEDVPEGTPITEITVKERIPDFDRLMKASRVVLAGDAAHAMTMFRGNGANQAVVDANVLATEIIGVVSGKKSLAQAVADYYHELVPRGQKAVIESHESAEMFHHRPEEIYETFKHLANKK